MIQKLIWGLSLCLALLLAIPVLIFLWFLLGGWIIPTLLFIILATLTLISYYKDISIPVLRKLLKREYLRVKFSLNNKRNRTNLNKLYLKFLSYLILLFKSSEHSYLVIKEELLDKFTKTIHKPKHQDNEKLNKVKDTLSKLKKGEQPNEQATLELENYLFQFNKHKQKTATLTSVTALVALIMVSLVSSLIFPAFLTKAATYNFTQATWSGGTSATVATHTSNQSDWDKYTSKDTNVSVGTTMTLATSSSTSSIDFTTEGNYTQEDSSKTEFSSGVIKLQSLSGNYFGEGTDGDVTISSNTDLTVPNKDGSYNGDMVVKHYNSLTINESVTLTTDQPGKGMMIYVKEDLTVNGTLSMTARGAYVNPETAGVSSTGLRIIREKSGGTDTLSASDLAGCGTAATTAEANQGAISSNGTIFKVERMGAAGGGPDWRTPGQSGDYMSGGGGGGGGGGMGAQGTCFSGGSAGGGSSNATSYGGQGGSCSKAGCGGGAGNPGGTGVNANGPDGTGGLLEYSLEFL
ncbi:MAG: hypothetical protein U9P50_02370 [Patescibacteria group bacterium]|nr:hypothetical protein [Patescibacteria group bacterium]